MAILTLPSVTQFKSVSFGLIANTQEFRSPLSQSVQTLELVGQRWRADYELPIMARPDAAPWTAFLSRLKGRAGRFYSLDPAAMTPLGNAGGSPIIATASQTGQIVVTAGWTANVPNILKAGDYLSWNTPTGWRELHQAVVDVGTDASGVASLTMVPPIREIPSSGATITKSGPTCVMMLTADDTAVWRVEETVVYQIRFSAEEAFSDTF